MFPILLSNQNILKKNNDNVDEVVRDNVSTKEGLKLNLNLGHFNQRGFVFFN